jgi:hypothetical protein
VSEPSQSTRTYDESNDSTVTELARKTHAPIEAVKQLYAEELVELRSKSKVRNFINVIAGRRVRERLIAHGSRFIDSHKTAPPPR